jgi:hypothetical protein
VHGSFWPVDEAGHLPPPLLLQLVRLLLLLHISPHSMTVQGNFGWFAWPVATFSILRTTSKRSLINLNKCTKLGAHKPNGGAVSKDHCHNHHCCCCCCWVWHYSTAGHTILSIMLLRDSWGLLAGLVTPTRSATAISTAAAAAAAINVLLLLLLLLQLSTCCCCCFTSPRIR